MARIIKHFDEILDILDNIKGGQFVTIGYISVVKNWQNTPKKNNVKTGKVSNRNDYNKLSDIVGGERPNHEQIQGFIKITRYTGLNYLNETSFKKQSDIYKAKRDVIYKEFNISNILAKQTGQDSQKGNWGAQDSTHSVYTNADNSKKYSRQNVVNAKKDNVYYTIDENGNIIDIIKPSSIKPYLKSYGIPYEQALRKSGMGDIYVNDYVKKMTEINRRFMINTFSIDNVLYILATVNGEKILYINDQIKPMISSKIQVDVNQLLDMVKEELSGKMFETKLKRLIRNLTEQTIHNII